MGGAVAEASCRGCFSAPECGGPRGEAAAAAASADTIPAMASPDSAAAISEAEPPATGDAMDKLLNQLVEKLRKAHGERLVSVVLYGSGAAGEHQARFSDWNVLCVLTEITSRELGSSEEIIRWWREHRSP